MVSVRDVFSATIATPAGSTPSIAVVAAAVVVVWSCAEVMVVAGYC